MVQKVSGSAVEFRQVTRRFSEGHGISDITFCLEKGEVLSICGPSGSGKTTILRLIAGLETVQSGSILLGSQPVADSNRSIAPHLRNCSMIFQDLALWYHMTVAEHLHFVLSGIPKQERKDRAVELLAKVQLEKRADIYPDHLSGGEQQRLAIIRALANEPDYLLMDEPFTSLDFNLKYEMVDLLKSLKRKSSLSIVYVTHDVREILHLSDQVLVLDNGHPVFYGNNSFFVSRYQDDIRREQEWFR